MGRKAFSFSATTVTVVVLFLFAAIFSVAVYADDDDDDHDHDHSPSSTPVATPMTNCADKLKVNADLMPFDTSSLICHAAWTSRDFILMYKQDKPGLWSFVLSAPESNGYIAVGFSPTGKMVKSSAVVGWMTATGKGMARQYYLGGKSSRQCKPDAGDLLLVDNKTLIVSESSRLYLAFQLTASEPLSKLIYAIGPDGSLPGSDLLLAHHKDMISTTVNYSSGESEESDEEEEETLHKTHGYLTLLGWGVLVPVGVLAARYGKSWDPTWFYSHIAIQGVGFCVGLAGIIAGFKLEDESGDEVDTHKSIGIVVLVLGTLQVLATLARPEKSSKVRKYWNWYHHNVGRAAIACAIGNIFYGLYLADEESSWRIGYGVFLGVWGLVALVLEVRMCVKKD